MLSIEVKSMAVNKWEEGLDRIYRKTVYVRT